MFNLYNHGYRRLFSKQPSVVSLGGATNLSTRCSVMEALAQGGWLRVSFFLMNVAIRCTSSLSIESIEYY